MGDVNVMTYGCKFDDCRLCESRLCRRGSGGVAAVACMGTSYVRSSTPLGFFIRLGVLRPSSGIAKLSPPGPCGYPLLRR